MPAVNPDGTPGNVAEDELIESAWGNAVADSITLLRRLTGVRVRRASPQLISTSSATEISWDTEDIDGSGYFAGPSPEIVVPSGLGGLHLIGGQLAAAANTGTDCYADIKLNGTVVQRYPARENAAPPFPMWLAHLADGDAIRVAVFHNAGLSVNFAGTIIVARLNSGL